MAAFMYVRDNDGNLIAIPVLQGPPGGHYTPVVSQPDDNTLLFDFVASTAGMPAVEPAQIKLPGAGSGQNVSNADVGNIKTILYNLMTIIKAQVEDEDGTPQGYNMDVSGLVAQNDDLIAALGNSDDSDGEGDGESGGDSGDNGNTGDDTHTHSYTSKVTTAATCTTAGVRTYTCSCGNSYTEAIPATGHNYVDGVCTVCGTADPSYSSDVTLTSISAAYSGGDVAVGTALTDLTGIVVTAHYSDGSSEPVTGYTLSGEITEGENIITVSYGGMTTTFAVTGGEVVEYKMKGTSIVFSEVSAFDENGDALTLPNFYNNGYLSTNTFESDTDIHIVGIYAQNTHQNNYFGSYDGSTVYNCRAVAAGYSAENPLEIYYTVKAGCQLLIGFGNSIKPTLTITGVQ